VNYHQTLDAENAINTLEHWLPVLAISILFHLAILFVIKPDLSTTLKNGSTTNRPITVILQKKPAFQKPAPDSTNKSKQSLIQAKTGYVKPTLTSTNNKAAKPRIAKQKLDNKPVATPNQPKIIANIVNKNEAKRHLPSDWEATAKEAIRENIEKESLQNQHQGELWLKSPSDMYGKPRDHFDRQDKRAMLTDTHESNKKSLFPNKKQKFAGIGIKLGKSCFLGFKAVDEDERKLGKEVSNFSCDF
jgi:hypothetical protein